MKTPGMRIKIPSRSVIASERTLPTPWNEPCETHFGLLAPELHKK